jgi:C-terminal processing protease CtpA/Prc
MKAPILILFNIIFLVACTHPNAVTDSSSHDLIFNKELVKDDTLSSIQIQRLYETAKVWGVLKYCHPNIVNGSYDMDLELAKQLPIALCEQRPIDSVLTEWCNQYGKLRVKKEIKAPRWMLNGLSPGTAHIINIIWSSKSTSRKSHYVKIDRQGRPSFQNEKQYREIENPSQTFRLLSLFRYWNIINHYYANIDLLDNWDNVLKEFIPIFFASATKREYIEALNRLTHEIEDGHGVLYSDFDPYKYLFGDRKAAIGAMFVGDTLVVTSIPHTLLNNEISRGDEVVTVNGIGIKDIIQERTELTAASNTKAIYTRISEQIFRTDRDTLEIQIKNKQREVSHVKLPTYPAKDVNLESIPDTCFRQIGTVGYLYTGTYKNKYKSRIKKALKHTQALIIDLRCYPGDYMLYSFGELLSKKRVLFAKTRVIRSVQPRDFKVTDAASVGALFSFSSYDKPVYVLVDENTFSQAEYTALAYSALPNVTVVGSQTAGADGDIAEIWLPGRMLTYISSISVLDRDGNNTQQIGIIPKIIVTPSVEDIREGNDAVLNYVMKLLREDKPVAL